MAGIRNCIMEHFGRKWTYAPVFGLIFFVEAYTHFFFQEELRDLCEVRREIGRLSVYRRGFLFYSLYAKKASEDHIPRHEILCGYCYLQKEVSGEKGFGLRKDL